MSLGSTLKHVLGVVVGVLIPGVSKDTVNLTSAVQQHLADAFGEAAADLAARLAVDTTGMSGPDKVFAIARAMVAEAKKQGFKGDARILLAAALDVAQAAYRKAEPNFGSEIVAVAAALTSNPLATVGVEILAQWVQAEADKLLLPATAPSAQAA